MKKLVSVLLLACTACGAQGATVAFQSGAAVTGIAAATAERRQVLEHRRIVQRDLTALRAQCPSRVARSQPSPGRTLGLELVVRLNQPENLEKAQARYLELDADERQRCLKVFKEKAPRTAQAQAVLEALRSDDGSGQAEAGRPTQHIEYAP